MLLKEVKNSIRKANYLKLHANGKLADLGRDTLEDLQGMEILLMTLPEVLTENDLSNLQESQKYLEDTSKVLSRHVTTIMMK